VSPFHPARRRASLAAVAAALAAFGLASGCGVAAGSGGGPAGPAQTLRLGYFPNVTHATALVGVAKGFYAKRLGATTLQTQTFNAGPAETEALLSGALDAGYIGPSPSINAWAKTKGTAIRIIAGATSGGASLVVKPGIRSPADLKGKTLATPQLGNTQDVALRSWLKDNGLTASSATQQGDVSVEPTENATTLQLFLQGKIDGAWVPEPWASRLVLDGGGSVLVDERRLWPGGKFVTTDLIVRTDFLDRHPQTVKALLEGQADANDWIEKNPAAAKATVNAELKRLTGKALSGAVIDRAWSQIAVTNDPLAASLKTSADHAVAAGLVKPVDLDGIYDLRLLRAVLAARGEGGVDDAGLGRSG
jgi:NitT/TauT family transport system substrate-binding protein